MSSFWDLFKNEREDEPPPELPPCAVDFDPDYVYWALSDLPLKRATEHFLSCGTIGSGKTTGIRLFLQSILPRFQADHPHNEQLIIFDAKGNAIPMLAGMGFKTDSDNFWILNPFDQRGAKWNIGEAINSPAMARYLANLMIPRDTNSNAPYFSNAAQEIVCWIAIALMQIRGTEWTLRDLLNALQSKKKILDVAARFPEAEIVIKQYTDDTQHFPGVLSGIATKIGKFHEVAALWDSSESTKVFSIKDFLKQRGVLILGHDPVLKESIWPMNAILLQALTNEILRRPDTPLPSSWFVLDEFRSMQRVDAVASLLNLGRSKGASVLLGIQSVEGLTEIYGKEGAEEMLGLCSNKTFLRAGGPTTAEWAERHFNRIRQTEESYTVNQSGRSYNYQTQERALFLASVFLDLPMPEKGGPFRAINDIPCFRQVLINDWLVDDVFAMLKDLAKLPGVILRDNPADQFLRPWTAKEELQICNTTSPETPPQSDFEHLTTKDEQQQRRNPQ